MLDLDDLKREDGKDNTPGLKTRILFAPEAYFADGGIKKVGADNVTITGPHTFKPNFGFVEIYGTLDTGEFKLDTVGNRDSRGKSVNFSFVHPGNSKEAAVFDRVCKNTSGIMLIEEMDGTLVQLGSEGLGVEISGAYGSGKVSGGDRGWNFSVTGYQTGMQHYTGAITLKRNAEVVTS